MKTAISTVAGLTFGLLLIPALAFGQAKDKVEKKPKEKEKVQIPKFDVPKLDLPKVDGIKAAPSDDPTANSQPDRAGDGPPFLVKKLLHAYGFAGGGARPCAPHKAYVGFSLHHFPDAIAPFQSCVQLSVSRSGRQAVRVELLSPNGDSVMTAGDAVAVGKNQKTFDYIVQWDGFTARVPGTYTFKVWLGDTLGGAFPIAVASEEESAAPDAGSESGAEADAGAAPKKK